MENRLINQYFFLGKIEKLYVYSNPSDNPAFLHPQFAALTESA